MQKSMDKAVVENRIQKYAEALKKRFPWQVRLNAHLARYTTYRVGGPATILFEPGSVDDLRAVLRECREQSIPVFVLGSGSNILVHDRGLNQVVIRLNRCCSRIFHEGTLVYAGAGAALMDLVLYAEKEGLDGVEYLAGIPGTVGGALRMNAGAFVGEIGDKVKTIEALSFSGERLAIPAAEAGFGYRRADHLQDKVLTGCWLQLQPGEPLALRRAREDYLKRREARQPLEYGSCGSVFKRPPGHYAGSLIEQAGCKGMRVGGAKVSEKHANFIINFDQARAIDIFELILRVQQRVYRKFGIWLEPEVKFVGFSEDELQQLGRGQ